MLSLVPPPPRMLGCERIFLQAQFLFSFGLQSIHIMVYGEDSRLFWKAPCLAGLQRDVMSWSEDVFSKALMAYIRFWSQEVVASTPKLFLTGLRASLSLWISVCKMGPTVVHAFVGTSLWWWKRVCSNTMCSRSFSALLSFINFKSLNAICL